MPGTGGHPGLSVPAPGHHRRSGCAHGSVHRWPCCLSAPVLAIGSIPSFPERTTWSRALEGLGVTQILAHSPQAKGRVERAKGTFQDRLVAELRLAGASTLEEANQVLAEFLPRFNQRFGVPAAQPESAYWAVDPELDWVACCASRSCAAWPKTTRCDTTGGPCTSIPVWRGPATLGPG